MMQEFKQYLQHELNKLNAAEPLKIQVRDDSGHFTNWITLPGISTAELLELLSPRQSFSITARRWRDLNGNTYHTVTIYENGKEWQTSPITYGYGRQYAWTALKMLQVGGKIGDMLSSPPEWEREDVTDVKRKKDL